MKKLMGILTIIVYDLFLALIGDSLGFTVTGEIVQDVPTEVTTNLSKFFDTLEYLGNILLFQVSGDIPDLVRVFFFYLPNVFFWLLLLFIIFNRGD